MLERNKISEGRREGGQDLGREVGKPLETQRSKWKMCLYFWSKVFTYDIKPRNYKERFIYINFLIDPENSTICKVFLKITN